MKPQHPPSWQHNSWLGTDLEHSRAHAKVTLRLQLLDPLVSRQTRKPWVGHCHPFVLPWFPPAMEQKAESRASGRWRQAWQAPEARLLPAPFGLPWRLDKPQLRSSPEYEQHASNHCGSAGQFKWQFQTLWHSGKQFCEVRGRAGECDAIQDCHKALSEQFTRLLGRWQGHPACCDTGSRSAGQECGGPSQSRKMPMIL